MGCFHSSIQYLAKKFGFGPSSPLKPAIKFSRCILRDWRRRLSVLIWGMGRVLGVMERNPLEETINFFTWLINKSKYFQNTSSDYDFSDAQFIIAGLISRQTRHVCNIDVKTRQGLHRSDKRGWRRGVSRARTKEKASERAPVLLISLSLSSLDKSWDHAVLKKTGVLWKGHFIISWQM